jgi:acyl transferase domain-containing protein
MHRVSSFSSFGSGSEYLSLGFEASRKLFVFAANSEDTGKKMMGEISQYLKSKNDCEAHDLMDDLAFTLAERRSMLPWKTTVPASSLSELIQNLENGNSKFVRSSRVPKIGFMFTGQGAQWAGMGRELFGLYEVFDQTLDQVEKHLQKLGASWRLSGKLRILGPF